MFETIAFLVTYILFGSIGYYVSRRFKRPLTITGFIALLLLTIVSQAILPQTRIIGIFEFNIYFGPSLQALLAGVLLGRTIRAIKTASS